jgi:hypothetical protein
MADRFMSLAIVALTTAAATGSTVLTISLHGVRTTTAQGTAQLHAYGSRSARQQLSAAEGKFDGALADLSRHAARADPAHVLADLHSLSPAARFKLAADGVTPLVAIDAVTVGDPRRLEAALETLGLQHAAVYANDVGGWLPVAQLSAASERAEVHSLRAVMPRRRSGAVTSQGDFVQHSAAVRSSDSLTGAGVTVGVLSDSFNCYAVYANPANGVPVSGYAGYAFNGFTADETADVSSGDLPSGVDVLEEASCLNYDAPLQPPFGDEGRAMLQIVHDVAPGASLEFYTAEDSEADFANGITALATAGARIIADDVGYFDEPFYQDGLVAQAIDAVEADGVAYFSAAGNDANASYENTAPSFGAAAASGSDAGEKLLNFDTSGATVTTALPITIAAMMPGELTAIVVEWDQPYVTGAPDSGGATSQIDICVTGATTEFTIQDDEGNDVTCTGVNKLGTDPVQILIIANPANATSNTPQETLSLVVGLGAGNAPGRVKVAVLTDGQTSPPPLSQFATNSATLQGHPGAAGAVAVGAAFYFNTPACGTTPAVIEDFSSQGGTPILFDSSGTRLATAVVRQKPDLTGPDGGNDTFLGFTLASGGETGANGQLNTGIAECQNDAAYPNFFGTSAATPHVAAIAALMLQANSTLTPAAIYAALRGGTLPMGGAAGFNFTSGFGFVQADAAFALIPPGAPQISASASSVASGQAVTITWSSINAMACAASGSWSGSLAASGTTTVTPAVGTDTYTLTCSNAAGASAAASTTVTVNAPATVASGSGGGGSIDWPALLSLAGLGFAARRRSRAKSPQSSNDACRGAGCAVLQSASACTFTADASPRPSRTA